jgi:hypothetical protein
VTAALGSPLSIPGVDCNSFFLGGVLGRASFGIAANSTWSFFLDRDNRILCEMLAYPMNRSASGCAGTCCRGFLLRTLRARRAGSFSALSLLSGFAGTISSRADFRFLFHFPFCQFDVLSA